jgi:hypothetical protein
MALTEVTRPTPRALRAANDTDAPAARLRAFVAEGGQVIGRWELTRHAENIMRSCRGLVCVEGWCLNESNSLSADFVRIERTRTGFSKYVIVHEGVTS